MNSEPNVRLRPLETGDLEFTRRWRNDPDISDLTLGRVFPTTDLDEQQWLESIGGTRWPSDLWWVVSSATHDHCGLVMLREIDWISRRARFGIWVSGELQNKGIGRRATELTLAEARRRLGLRKVSLDVRADHDVAMAMYSDLGFTEEGRLAQHTYADGEYRDVAVMSILWDEP